MCICEDWRCSSRVVALLEMIGFIIGSIIMTVILCVHSGAIDKNSSTAARFYGTAEILGTTHLTLHFIVHFLGIPFSILLVIATGETRATSNPKQCYRMTCAWVIFATLQIIVFFVEGGLLCTKGVFHGTILYTFLLAFLQLFLAQPVIQYAAVLYKKCQPQRDLVVNRFGNVSEFRETPSYLFTFNDNRAAAGVMAIGL